MERKHFKRKETKISKIQDSKTEVLETGHSRTTTAEIVVESTITETEVSIDRVGLESSRTAPTQRPQRDGEVKNKRATSSHTIGGGDSVTATRNENLHDAGNRHQDIHSATTPNAFPEEFESSTCGNTSPKKYSELFGKKYANEETYYEIPNANINFTELSSSDEDDVFLRNANIENCYIPDNASSNLIKIDEIRKIKDHRKSDAGSQMKSTNTSNSGNSKDLRNSNEYTAKSDQLEKDDEGQLSVSDLVIYFESLKPTKPKGRFEYLIPKNKAATTTESTNLKNFKILSRKKCLGNSAVPSMVANDDRTRKRPLEYDTSESVRKHFKNMKSSSNVEVSSGLNTNSDSQLFEQIFLFPDDNAKTSMNEVNDKPCRSRYTTKRAKPVEKATLPLAEEPKLKGLEGVVSDNSDKSKELSLNATVCNQQASRISTTAKDENFKTVSRCKEPELKKCIIHKFSTEKKDNSPKKEWNLIKRAIIGIIVFSVACTIICNFA